MEVAGNRPIAAAPSSSDTSFAADCAVPLSVALGPSPSPQTQLPGHLHVLTLGKRQNTDSTTDRNSRWTEEKIVRVGGCSLGLLCSYGEGATDTWQAPEHRQHH